MKRWILDVSDCVESPLLAESKHRHKWDKRSWMDLYVVEYGELRTRSSPQITGLTEKFFANESAEAQAETQEEVFNVEMSGLLGMSLL